MTHPAFMFLQFAIIESKRPYYYISAYVFILYIIMDYCHEKYPSQFPMESDLKKRSGKPELYVT